MPPFHEAEHFARHAADLQRLAIEGARERVEGPHDVADCFVAVDAALRRFGLFSLLPDAGVSLLDHLLAEVDPDQVVLKNVVVEHVFGGFAEIDDPFSEAPAA